VYQPITEARSNTCRREPLSAARWMAVARPVCWHLGDDLLQCPAASV